MAGATWTWTILPQILIGLGLGLTISALTDAALHGRSHQVVHGGWTIASRHAGVVLGLLLLTPIFTADLKRNTRDAELAGTALLLDADLAPDHKLDLAQALAKRLRASGGRLPTLEPVFAANPAKDSEAAAQAKLQGDLQGQIERAATDAFSRSFLAAAILGLLALIPIAAQGNSSQFWGAPLETTLVALASAGPCNTGGRGLANHGSHPLCERLPSGALARDALGRVRG